MSAPSVVPTAVVTAIDGELAELAERFVAWLETGVRRDGLLADDVFADLTLPHWRVQADGADAAFRLREDSHPFPGVVRVEELESHLARLRCSSRNGGGRRVSSGTAVNWSIAP